MQRPANGGVTVSKSYQMLCGSCSKRFTKVMIVDMSESPEDKNLSLYDIQGYFNSVLNHEYECPFCSYIVQIILSTNLLIGDVSQIDYTRIHKKD